LADTTPNAQTHTISGQRDSKQPVKSEYAVLKNGKDMGMQTRLTGSKIMHHLQLDPCHLDGDGPFSVLLCQEHSRINGEVAFADRPL